MSTSELNVLNNRKCSRKRTDLSNTRHEVECTEIVIIPVLWIGYDAAFLFNFTSADQYISTDQGGPIKSLRVSTWPACGLDDAQPITIFLFVNALCNILEANLRLGRYESTKPTVHFLLFWNSRFRAHPRAQMLMKSQTKHGSKIWSQLCPCIGPVKNEIEGPTEGHCGGKREAPVSRGWSGRSIKGAEALLFARVIRAIRINPQFLICWGYWNYLVHLAGI